MNSVVILHAPHILVKIIIKQNNRIPADAMDASKTISRHRGFPSETIQ